MIHDQPPAALDVVSDGTATGFSPIKSLEFSRACDVFLRSRGLATGGDHRFGGPGKLIKRRAESPNLPSDGDLQVS